MATTRRGTPCPFGSRGGGMCGIHCRAPQKHDCPICLDDVRRGKVLKCGHVFHARCIHKWLHASKMALCPMCRQPCYAEFPRAKLSKRVRILENTSVNMHTAPVGFWPAWLVASMDDNPMFSDADRCLLKSLAYQSFNGEMFYQLLHDLQL